MKSLLPSVPVAPVSCIVSTAVYLVAPYKADLDLVTVSICFSRCHTGIVAKFFQMPSNFSYLNENYFKELSLQEMLCTRLSAEISLLYYRMRYHVMKILNGKCHCFY